MFQELESFLLAANGAKFSIPELNLLKQRHSGACSWVNHANNILGKLYARSDYHNVIEELTVILKDGESLRVEGMLCKYFSMDIAVFAIYDYSHFHKSYCSMQLMNCRLLRKN